MCFLRVNGKLKCQVLRSNHFQLVTVSMKLTGYLFAALRTGTYRTSQKRVCSFVASPATFRLTPRPGRVPTDNNLLTRTMSSDAANKNTNYNEEIQILIDQMKQPFPLIDVDCNLLHQDLTSMLAESSDDIYQATSSANLRILHHPSTVASNIHGVFSPSSTIDEAENFHSILLESTRESRNDIDVRMGVGVHPYHAEEAGELTEELESSTRNRIDTLFAKDKLEGKGFLTCIGEMGLDYSEGFPHKDKQLPWFEFQLRLAKQYSLPIFIHERLAFEDTISLIDEVFADTSSCPPIIIHCFTGSKEECKKYIERGYFLSVSGYILKNGDGPDEVKDCLRSGIIPMDKLMIETDAPYMGFNSCRDTYYEFEAETNAEFQAFNSKKRKRLIKGIYPNAPSSLPKVLDSAVELLNEGRRDRNEEELSTKDVARMFFENAANFFGIQS